MIVYPICNGLSDVLLLYFPLVKIQQSLYTALVTYTTKYSGQHLASRELRLELLVPREPDPTHSLLWAFFLFFFFFFFFFGGIRLLLLLLFGGVCLFCLLLFFGGGFVCLFLFCFFVVVVFLFIFFLLLFYYSNGSSFHLHLQDAKENYSPSTWTALTIRCFLVL